MNNNIQRYNAQQEFAIDRVYTKLTRGIDELPADEAVEALINGASRLRQGITQIVERLFEGAEVKHSVVMHNVSVTWVDAAENVRDALDEASLTGNYAVVEKALRESTMANIRMQESAGKMRYIKSRGQGEYDSAKELAACVKELEEFAKKYASTPKQLGHK